MLALVALAIFTTSASAAAPTILSTGVSGVTTSSAALEASINPNGKLTSYHFEYGTSNCASSACTSLPEGTIPIGSSPKTVKSSPVEGLSPGTVYHFRVVAKNGATAGDKAESPDRVFAVYPAPLSGLPDNRAYEQASPIDKDGGDAIGTVPQLKAPPQGGAITFSSTVGIPGGVGAQDLPLYLATRSPSGWSSQGLLPPASEGQQAHVLGWLPDFAQVFSSAFEIGEPGTGALLGMPGSGPQIPEELVPPLPNAGYAFVGSGEEGSEVVFESRASLGSSPAGVEGASNVYAWDRESKEVSLVSVLNNGEPLAKGAFGGSYDWALGMTPTNLGQGGAARNYYTQDQHAVADNGAVFFTEAGTGQLYMRANPTQPQSALSAGKCTEPDRACTYHVSESQRTPPDSGGPRPAAFMGAAADGSSAFFTSPEKLTDDANTGPVQPKPKIGRADIGGTTNVEPDWLADHRAVGIAVDSEYIYWADPADGTIGRAKLDGTGANDEFIRPGTTTAEDETEPGSGEFITLVLPSKPRYVAVGAGRICWTNTADGHDKHGTIGCADLDGEGNPVNEDPECITGASNPQGIALNATHIYWANAGSGDTSSSRSIGRAEIDCSGAVPDFQFMPFQSTAFSPYGVALSATHLYWTMVADSGNASVRRVPLEGGADEEFFGISNTAQLRGLVVQGEDLYWAAQGEKAIGLAVWPDAQPAPTTVEKEFIKLEGAPSGVAVDTEHVYWSTDGETAPSPGNDLYRFVPDGKGGGALTDLTPDQTDKNGAEVQGVVGVSRDGSRVYFVANADLDGPGDAKAGTCRGPLRLAQGQCSLYLWHEETVGFVARLDLTGASLQSDAANLAPTTTGIFGSSDFQKPAFLSADGQTLLFRSQEQLSDYDNEGIPELYRYREGEPIACVSCNPSGQPPQGAPLGLTLGSLKPSALRVTEPASLASRNLSADGDRAFFETTEALVASDTNGQGEGCKAVGSVLQEFPACRDVYEWEAPGSGSCEESSPAFSPLNGGCLYLISTGKDDYPSFFADASEDGKDVFFFTRQGLVGQDKDELLDVYDARVDGGIASQNPLSQPACESAEACHGPVPPAAAQGQPTSQTFVGPGNEIPKPGKKAKKHKKHKKHHKKKQQKHRRANSKRRAPR